MQLAVQPPQVGAAEHGQLPNRTLVEIHADEFGAIADPARNVQHAWVFADRGAPARNGALERIGVQAAVLDQHQGRRPGQIGQIIQQRLELIRTGLGRLSSARRAAALTATTAACESAKQSAQEAKAGVPRPPAVVEKPRESAAAGGTRREQDSVPASPPQ